MTCAAEASFSRYPAAPARTALRKRSESSSISTSRVLIEWGRPAISCSRGHSGGRAVTESMTRTSVPESKTNLAIPGTQGKLPHTLKEGLLPNSLARASRRRRFSATRKTHMASDNSAKHHPPARRNVSGAFWHEQRGTDVRPDHFCAPSKPKKKGGGPDLNRLPRPQGGGDLLAPPWSERRGASKFNFDSSRVHYPDGFVGSGERPTAWAFGHSDRPRWFQQPARPVDKWLTRPSVGRGLMIPPLQDIED
jgi:hypothetical protein